MIPLYLSKLPLTPPVMTSGAWIFMGLGWLGVSLLVFWCFRRVLGGGKNP